MIVFGGKSNGYHNDVWSLDLSGLSLEKLISSHSWQLLQISNSISGRYGHTSFVISDEMFVFGGYGTNGPSNELFSLDLNKMEWKEEKWIGEKPLARYFHTAVCDCDTNVWIFGGKGHQVRMNELLRIKIGSATLREIECQVVSKGKGRFGHSSCLEGSTLYIVGGCDEDNDHLDVLSCDLNGKYKWNEEKKHALNTIITKENSGTFLPVFHTLTPYKIDNRLEYCLFGGKFQKTIITKNETTSKKKRNYHPLSDEVFNMDIFRIIVSFLHPLNLLKLQLVSKSLSICTLTDELFVEGLCHQKNNRYEAIQKAWY